MSNTNKSFYSFLKKNISSILMIVAAFIMAFTFMFTSMNKSDAALNYDFCGDSWTAYYFSVQDDTSCGGIDDSQYNAQNVALKVSSDSIDIRRFDKITASDINAGDTKYKNLYSKMISAGIESTAKVGIASVKALAS